MIVFLQLSKRKFTIIITIKHLLVKLIQPQLAVINSRNSFSDKEN